MDERKLNVGCGTDIRSGWINLDSTALPGVDVVHDIERLPWPFADAAFDVVLCQDVLEHTDYIPIMRECWRIMKKDARLIIRVPHFTSKNNFSDPTHRRLFSINTFEFFCAAPAHAKARGRGYYFDFHFARVLRRRITFERSSRIYLYNRLVEALINRSARMQDIYESTLLARLFPAENIVAELIK